MNKCKVFDRAQTLHWYHPKPQSMTAAPWKAGDFEMRAFIKTIVATAALAAPLYANAIPVTWNYAGVCTHGDCDVVSSITGTLTGDPGVWGPSNQLNEYFLFGDLTSYSFNVGGYEFSGARGLGSYQLDGAGNIVGGTMSFGNILALEFLDVGAATWHIIDTDCRFLIFCSVDTEAVGTGSYTRATAVPEPTSLALLGLGLLGLGMARRRRTAR